MSSACCLLYYFSCSVMLRMAVYVLVAKCNSMYELVGAKKGGISCLPFKVIIIIYPCYD